MTPLFAGRGDESARESTPAARRHQVVVAGGGTAGWVAALAAARGGADVLLVERRHHLGGNLASGLPILGFFNVDSQQIVHGIAHELVERLLPLRGTGGYQLVDTWQSSQVSLEPLVVKSVIQELLEEAGVRLLFAAQVTDALIDSPRLAGIVVQKRSGREVIGADLFIDATGDAELAYQAAVPVQLGAESDGSMQPPTILVRLLDVDVRGLRDYLKRHPETS
jgi:flavin-dependent dehydrogenase